METKTNPNNIWSLWGEENLPIYIRTNDLEKFLFYCSSEDSEKMCLSLEPDAGSLTLVGPSGSIVTYDFEKSKTKTSERKLLVSLVEAYPTKTPQHKRIEMSRTFKSYLCIKN